MRRRWGRPGAYRNPPTTPATWSSPINIPTSVFRASGLSAAWARTPSSRLMPRRWQRSIDPAARGAQFRRAWQHGRARPLRILRGARFHAAPAAGRAEVAIVRAFMAHHQGMTIVAIAEHLARGAHARAVPSRADVQGGGVSAAGAHAPRDRHGAILGRGGEAAHADPRARDDRPLARRPIRTPRPVTHLLSNGRYP